MIMMYLNVLPIEFERTSYGDKINCHQNSFYDGILCSKCTIRELLCTTYTMVFDDTSDKYAAGKTVRESIDSLSKELKLELGTGPKYKIKTFPLEDRLVFEHYIHLAFRKISLGLKRSPILRDYILKEEDRKLISIVDSHYSKVKLEKLKKLERLPKNFQALTDKQLQDMYYRVMKFYATFECWSSAAEGSLLADCGIECYLLCFRSIERKLAQKIRRFDVKTTKMVLNIAKYNFYKQLKERPPPYFNEDIRDNYEGDKIS